MAGLVHERCVLHPAREAVARCPECERCYCRECVTEHEERVVCTACLRKLTSRAAPARVRFGVLARAAQCGLGVLVCWMFFYYLGQALLALPSSFHEGTLWQQPADDSGENEK